MSIEKKKQAVTTPKLIDEYEKSLEDEVKKIFEKQRDEILTTIREQVRQANIFITDESRKNIVRNVCNLWYSELIRSSIYNSYKNLMEESSQKCINKENFFKIDKFGGSISSRFIHVTKKGIFNGSKVSNIDSKEKLTVRLISQIISLIPEERPNSRLSVYKYELTDKSGEPKDFDESWFLKHYDSYKNNHEIN